VTAVIAGCGAEQQPTATNNPQDALRGFYAGIVRDHDVRAACRHVAPSFYLRPTNVVGYNVDAADPESPKAPEYRSTPRRGSCPKLAARIASAVASEAPWSAWKIESVKVAGDGRTADAVTFNGSAGLRLVGDEWRVAWVNDVP
jgi:hypothetical protein